MFKFWIDLGIWIFAIWLTNWNVLFIFQGCKMLGIWKEICSNWYSIYQLHKFHRYYYSSQIQTLELVCQLQLLSYFFIYLNFKVYLHKKNNKKCYKKVLIFCSGFGSWFLYLVHPLSSISKPLVCSLSLFYL